MNLESKSKVVESIRKGFKFSPLVLPLLIPLGISIYSYVHSVQALGEVKRAYEKRNEVAYEEKSSRRRMGPLCLDPKKLSVKEILTIIDEY